MCIKIQVTMVCQDIEEQPFSCTSCQIIPFDACKKHRNVIESKCCIIKEYYRQNHGYPIHVENIKCTSHSATYKKLESYLSVAQNSHEWQNWIKRYHNVTESDAIEIVCKAKKNVDQKYLLWWKKYGKKRRDFTIYFSKEMMQKDYGIIIKSNLNAYRGTPIGRLYDVSSLVVKRKKQNKVILFPGSIELNINQVNILPPFPTDANFEQTPSAKLLSNGPLVQLHQTRKGIFQLLVCYHPAAVEVDQKSKAQRRICGIDMGVRHFATIYDTLHGVIHIDVDTMGIFGRNKLPSKYQLQRLDQQIDQFHVRFIQFLVRNYSLIVIGNLSVEEDDYKKDFNRALKMKHFNYTKFRNLLIKHTFPRQETGCTVFVVDEFRTSKTCSACHYYDKNWCCNDSFFRCKKCKVKLNRDLNAAKNILNTVLKFKRNTALLQCS